jgi:methyltransferase (TIGR00027 family)
VSFGEIGVQSVELVDSDSYQNAGLRQDRSVKAGIRMARKAAKTGPGPMVMVAIEQHLPESERILNDDLAYRILPFGARASVWLKLRLMSVDSMVRWMEKKIPGMWGGFQSRKRYIDEKVTEALENRVEAVVNLGAGFDTRAYRLPALANVPVWEVDQAENIHAKRSRLRKVLGEVPPHVTLVPIDFDSEELGKVLEAYAYPPESPTFFIWEAVTQYLTEAGIQATFGFLAKAPAGSRLAFTYIRKDFIEGTALYGAEYLYKTMVLRDKSFLFGMNPEDMADFLGGFGWRELEHLGYEELAERYVKPTGRKLLSTPLERMVYAEKL